MRCPKCNQWGYRPPEACLFCQFGGTETLTEELAHVKWLLDEVKSWDMLSSWALKTIRQNYNSRYKQREIDLGVRLPPFSDEEAVEAWPELIKQHSFQQK